MARLGPPVLVFVWLAALGAGCSLVLDDPTPFVEARRDAAEPDRGPLLPDLAVEDAFVARPMVDMQPDAAPDAAPEPAPDMALDACTADADCLDGSP